jgi:hypothetical protein
LNAALSIDRLLLKLLVLLALGVVVARWLHDHPQHNPWAPLAIDHPPGWATGRKLAALRVDPAACRAVLERSGLAFKVLPPTGEGTCRREDRTVLSDQTALGLRLSPRPAEATCAVGAGLAIWLRHHVQPDARRLLGVRVSGLEHYGTTGCRRIGGGKGGRWSEHATGNAVDVSAFVTEDGRKISVRRNWNGTGADAAFLRSVRDGACEVFATVLSPDYNAAHADHLHFDQAGRGRGWSFCR